MYRGNREYFALKRQLIYEANQKLCTLPLEQSGDAIKRYDNRGLTFVFEWCDDGEIIFGYGCNSLGVACRIIPKIEPGLFVVSSDISILQEAAALLGYPIQVYDITYNTNNFAVHDLFEDYSVARPANLVKICTNTVTEAFRLYNKFKSNETSYKYVVVAQYFDVTKQIMFELLIRKVHAQIVQNHLKNLNVEIDYTIPESVMCWFDENLNVYKNFPPPKIPLITFDIETVSDDPHRLPTGMILLTKKIICQSTSFFFNFLCRRCDSRSTIYRLHSS